MCGRYTLIINDLGELESIFNYFPGKRLPEWKPAYNAAPTQMLPVITREHGISLMKWGLVPSWSKEAAIGNRMINARLETAAEKPAFRSSLRRRRCLVPADGYYEWQGSGRGKQPWRITASDGRVMVMAGLWDTWQTPEGGELSSFTILTMPAAESVAKLHDRMPVILPEEQGQEWLMPLSEPELKGCLARIKPPAELKAYRVSPLVNSPANNDPRCIQALEEI